MTIRRLVLFAVVLAVAASTRAQNLKSWDNQIDGSSRWKILSDFDDAAVLDKETGLVWEKDPISQQPVFANANFLCYARSIGGRRGWRLPMIFELMTLVDPSQTNPGLPPGHPFPNLTGTEFWSATTVEDNTANAWAVNFSFGTVTQAAKTTVKRMLCVRGPGGSPHQY